MIGHTEYCLVKAAAGERTSFKTSSSNMMSRTGNL